MSVYVDSKNRLTKKQQTIWLLFDLGLKGDYDGIYTWLDDNEARECGITAAVLKYHFKTDLISEIKKDLKKHIKLRESDRIYIIHFNRVENKMKGTWIFGKRKVPRWRGYAMQKTISDDTFDL